MHLVFGRISSILSVYRFRFIQVASANLDIPREKLIIQHKLSKLTRQLEIGKKARKNIPKVLFHELEPFFSPLENTKNSTEKITSHAAENEQTSSNPYGSSFLSHLLVIKPSLISGCSVSTIHLVNLIQSCRSTTELDLVRSILFLCQLNHFPAAHYQVSKEVILAALTYHSQPFQYLDWMLMKREEYALYLNTALLNRILYHFCRKYIKKETRELENILLVKDPEKQSNSILERTSSEEVEKNIMKRNSLRGSLRQALQWFHLYEDYMSLPNQLSYSFLLAIFYANTFNYLDSFSTLDNDSGISMSNSLPSINNEHNLMDRRPYHQSMSYYFEVACEMMDRKFRIEDFHLPELLTFINSLEDANVHEVTRSSSFPPLMKSQIVDYLLSRKESFDIYPNSAFSCLSSEYLQLWKELFHFSQLSGEKIYSTVLLFSLLKPFSDHCLITRVKAYKGYGRWLLYSAYARCISRALKIHSIQFASPVEIKVKNFLEQFCAFALEDKENSMREAWKEKMDIIHRIMLPYLCSLFEKNEFLEIDQSTVNLVPIEEEQELSPFDVIIEENLDGLHSQQSSSIDMRSSIPKTISQGPASTSIWSRLKRRLMSA